MGAMADWMATTTGHAVLGLFAGCALALVINHVLFPALARLAAKTRWTGDDQFVRSIRRPTAGSAVMAGAWYAVKTLGVHDTVEGVLVSTLASFTILMWTVALHRLSSASLQHLASAQSRDTLVKPRTLPIFDFAAKTLVFGSSTYLVLQSWGIDLTAWLASAGIVGIAVGFAAKDTLANLFAGVFILADTPYKIGDYLVLENNIRGRVTEIGLRSTRILTRDDIEVILPNSLMAGTKIINESGGRHTRQRVRCPVSVSYNADLDHVRAVLVDVAKTLSDFVQDDPQVAPRVRFRRFGESGIDVEVLAWIPKPEDRGIALDNLIVAIHSRFRAENIEIPFPQRTLHLVPAPDAREGQAKGDLPENAV